MQMKMASAISTGLHAAVLLWALVSFSGKTFEVTPAESLPVDLVSEKDFSEMTKGAKQAQRLEGFADEFAAILSRQIDERG